MIQLEGIEKIFTTEEVETTALRGLGLNVGAGEFVSIMGPSGSGKSTLLNILGLLDTPTGGSYRLFDEEVPRLSERRLTDLRRRHMGFVFQDFNLIDEMTVFENVELPLLYRGMTERERRRRVDPLLERFGMAKRRNHFPMQLSGGQQQRSAVARAVVGEPALVLADEPTGNLDSSNGEEVMGLLTDLNEKGTAIIMVTHALEWAQKGDHILNLLDGQLSSE